MPMEQDVILQSGILDPSYRKKRKTCLIFSLNDNISSNLPCCAQYPMLPSMSMLSSDIISPRMALIRDDFPDPTVPTTATKLFFLICNSMSFRFASSSLLFHLKEALLILTAWSPESSLMTFVRFSESSLRFMYLLILFTETLAWTRPAIIIGNMLKGNLKMLNKDNDTKAFSESNPLFSSTRT